MVTKISMWSRIQDSCRITPKIESLVVYAMPDIPSKFQKDPSITFWVILLTHKQTNKQKPAKTLPPWQSKNIQTWEYADKTPTYKQHYAQHGVRVMTVSPKVHSYHVTGDVVWLSSECFMACRMMWFPTSWYVVWSGIAGTMLQALMGVTLPLTRSPPATNDWLHLGRKT